MALLPMLPGWPWPTGRSSLWSRACPVRYAPPWSGTAR